MSSNVGYEDELAKVDLPEPLIYANADEFHVKSTVVYIGDPADGGVGNLYLDKALTKPVYNDKLERLFLAGGLKIAKIDPLIRSLSVYSPLEIEVFSSGKNTRVRTTAGDFSAHVRPTEDSLPSGPPEEESGDHTNV